MAVQYCDSPIGTIIIKAEAGFIKELCLVTNKILSESPDKLTTLASQQLSEYFDGRRVVFDLPIDPDGTAFQKSIWTELLRIPFGTTVTYSQIAAAAKNPKAFRAVGGAVGKNPILIIIPCHRVVAVNGLGGFSAGLDNKKYLLRHENIIK